jgi:hypothetical protein
VKERWCGAGGMGGKKECVHEGGGPLVQGAEPHPPLHLHSTMIQPLRFMRRMPHGMTTPPPPPPVRCPRTYIGPYHAPMLLQLPHHICCGVYRYGKRHPIGCHCLHARNSNDLAMQVDERTAGVALKGGGKGGGGGGGRG